MANDPTNAELGRGQARHEKDIERLENEVDGLRTSLTKEITELRTLIYTLERRLILGMALPVITLVVSVILTYVRLG